MESARMATPMLTNGKAGTNRWMMSAKVSGIREIRVAINSFFVRALIESCLLSRRDNADGKADPGSPRVSAAYA